MAEFLLKSTGVLAILLLFTPQLLKGQQRCGVYYYQQKIRSENTQMEDESKFEDWIHQHIPRRTHASQRVASSSYKVQVVVHIIHSGEPVGQGTNISAEQVASQISALNKDFNRMNSDAANTFAEFLPVAGSMTIQFVLAAQNPDGIPSTGINRVQGTKDLWTIDDDEELKSLSYWSSNDYLNIWVCNLSEYVGYSQFPVSTLPGLGNTNKGAKTDGVVISHRAFGSVDDGNFDLYPAFNKGRTTTHEVGHFLGLRHTWGDVEDCTGTDYVDDTPPQQHPTNGCPTEPEKQCPAEDPEDVMFQNFMDLTDGNCQNLFTIGQILRMQVVLENSPRRASLLLPLDTEVARPHFEKIFSPNGDGINDYWKWTDFTSYEGCTLSIFNRFGKKVYEITGYDGRWDGRASDGHMLEAEAYYYVIQCENQQEITGGVRIVR